jgi:hypothetical protein
MASPLSAAYQFDQYAQLALRPHIAIATSLAMAWPFPANATLASSDDSEGSEFSETSLTRHNISHRAEGVSPKARVRAEQFSSKAPAFASREPVPVPR